VGHHGVRSTRVEVVRVVASGAVNRGRQIFIKSDGSREWANRCYVRCLAKVGTRRIAESSDVLATESGNALISSSNRRDHTQRLRGECRSWNRKCNAQWQLNFRRRRHIECDDFGEGGRGFYARGIGPRQRKCHRLTTRYLVNSTNCRRCSDGEIAEWWIDNEIGYSATACTAGTLHKRCRCF